MISICIELNFILICYKQKTELTWTRDSFKQVRRAISSRTVTFGYLCFWYSASRISTWLAEKVVRERRFFAVLPIVGDEESRDTPPAIEFGALVVWVCVSLPITWDAKVSLSGEEEDDEEVDVLLEFGKFDWRSSFWSMLSTRSWLLVWFLFNSLAFPSCRLQILAAKNVALCEFWCTTCQKGVAERLVKGFSTRQKRNTKLI